MTGVNIIDLPRNDAKAALSYYRDVRDREGSVPGDDVSILLQLQDDPSELMSLLEKEPAEDV